MSLYNLYALLQGLPGPRRRAISSNGPRYGSSDLYHGSDNSLDVGECLIETSQQGKTCMDQETEGTVA
jgi:hypothetical protein